MLARKRWVFLACPLVVLFGACHQPSAHFNLVLTEASLMIAQGATGATGIATECDAGVVGTVTLTLESAPVGVSAAFVPDTSNCGATSTLNMAVAASVQPGTYAVHVQGESDGIVAQVQLTLIVAAGPADFALSLSPASLAIEQSLQATVAVTLVRDPGFPDDVVLAIIDAPPGIVGSFEPNPVTGSTSSLSLQVGSDAAVGVHALTVEATSGAVTHSADLTLTVTERGTLGGFDLLVEPTSLTLLRGQQALVAVTIERTAGFVDPVALSAVVDPSAQHIDLTFDPALAVDASTMTVAIGINVPPGSYQITVQGLSGRLGDNASLGLLVTE